MGFKVIGSDEELEAALAAGLLWMNVDVSMPRAQNEWMRVTPNDGDWAKRLWECISPLPRSSDVYLPEDFAVLVEEEDDSL